MKRNASSNANTELNGSASAMVPRVRQRLRLSTSENGDLVQTPAELEDG